MDVEVLSRGAFSSALVRISPGESFISEAGALYRATDNIETDVSTRGGQKGGIIRGLKRTLAQEGFFLANYTCTNDEEGEVGLAPTIEGEVALIDCDGSGKWICTGGSWLGSSESLQVDTQFQGLKGMFTGESVSFISVEGQGQLLVNAFGRINQLEVDGELTVDTGHVVAFQDTLEYSLSKAGGSWISSMLAGEGIVLKFKGRGTIYVQSHNPDEYGKTLGPKLPPQRRR